MLVDFSLSVSLLCLVMLFYSTYAGKVEGKATREHGCCIANVSIRCYTIFQETFSKWICKFVYYIPFSLCGLGEVCVILKDKFGWFCVFWKMFLHSCAIYGVPESDSRRFHILLI